MTFAELIATVKTRAQETSSTPVYWQDDDIKTALNEGYIDMSDASEGHEVTVPLRLAPGRTYYDLRTTLDRLGRAFLAVRKVYSETFQSWLEPRAPREIDRQEYTEWEGSYGSPKNFLIRGLWWLGLYPTPSGFTDRARVTAASLPTPLLHDGDTPWFPDQHAEGLIEYALYDLFAQDGETKKALYHWSQYVPLARALYQESRFRAAADIHRRLQSESPYAG